MSMSEILRLKKRLRTLLSEDGVLKTLARGCDKLSAYASYPLRKMELRGSSFDFLGRSFEYFCHHYNATWRNERCVEIALAKEKLAEYTGKRILEVGNVTPY